MLPISYFLLCLSLSFPLRPATLYTPILWGGDHGLYCHYTVIKHIHIHPWAFSLWHLRAPPIQVQAHAPSPPVLYSVTWSDCIGYPKCSPPDKTCSASEVCFFSFTVRLMLQMCNHMHIWTQQLFSSLNYVHAFGQNGGTECWTPQMSW